MTSCAGCNVTLGWKKYNFQKQWRIPGYYCKSCMQQIGQDFDDNGKITLPKKICDSCHQEFFFLTSVFQDKQRYRCCDVCKNIDFTKSQSKESLLPPIPSRVPTMMALFASFGILLMIAGFAYVILVAPQQDSGILHVILGSSMSGAGFMLARKMVKVRNIVLGKTNTQNTENLR